MVTALAGCSFSSKLNGSGFGGSSPSSGGGGGGGGSSGGSSGGGGGGSSAGIVVPDLRGLTAAQAEAALRSAGFSFDQLKITDYACEALDDRKMAPQDTVCDQHPTAGQDHAPRLITVSVTIEHDTFAHGSVGGSSEWRRMPELVGKALDVARTTLARVNLPLDQQFDLLEDGADGCQPQQVCHTEPAGNDRKVLTRKGRIYVGKARAAAAAAAAPTPTPMPAPAPAKPATSDTYF